MKHSKKPSFDNARRFYSNAKENLRKSPILYDRYEDVKYVKEASGMAYLAALEAIDSYFVEKKRWDPRKLPDSIEGYWNIIDKIPHNGKLSAALATVYENLHIGAYYRELTSVPLVKSGFEKAKLIIDMLSK